MITNWNDLTPALFEKLCAGLLKCIGFVNVQWFGAAGSDKGRDIIAEKIDSPVPGIKRKEIWMIQCKRYTKRSLDKSELKDLMDSALEHEIDYLLIIITSAVSSNLRDWTKDVQKRYPFRVYFWKEIDLRDLVNVHKSKLLESIPDLLSGREPIWMYERDAREVRFGCNEFEDIEILVNNADDLSEAQRRAAEFLGYIQNNGFDWWE